MFDLRVTKIELISGKELQWNWEYDMVLINNTYLLSTNTPHNPNGFDVDTLRIGKTYSVTTVPPKNGSGKDWLNVISEIPIEDLF